MQPKIILADYSDRFHGESMLMLLESYAIDPMGGGKPLSETVKANLIGSLLNHPTAFSVLSFVDDKPAGLVNCFEAFSTFECKPLVNIHDVIVLKEYRALGISQLMLKKVERIAREKGCCKLTLEVLEGNGPARHAYQKFGFAAYELDPAMGQAVFWQKKLKSD